MDYADDVQALFQFLNSGDIRMIIPRQPFLSLRSRSFFLVLIKTLDQNLGQGSSQLIWLSILFQENHSVHLSTKVVTTSVHPHTSKKCWRRQPKTNDGSSISKAVNIFQKKNEKTYIQRKAC